MRVIISGVSQPQNPQKVFFDALREWTYLTVCNYTDEATFTEAAVDQAHEINHRLNLGRTPEQIVRTAHGCATWTWEKFISGSKPQMAPATTSPEPTLTPRFRFVTQLVSRAEQFEKEINDLLDQGYTLHGAPVMASNGSNIITGQALILQA